MTHKLKINSHRAPKTPRLSAITRRFLKLLSTLALVLGAVTLATVKSVPTHVQASSAGAPVFQALNPTSSSRGPGPDGANDVHQSTPTPGLTVTATPPPSGSPRPTSSASATRTPTHSSIPAWDGNFHSYLAGDRVMYGRHFYRAIQRHRSQPNWEPPNAPALWQRVDD